MSILQPLSDLEKWHAEPDPWKYEVHPHDQRRVQMLLSEIPDRKYARVLDVGCGQGFVTAKLPGASVIGLDVSENAIQFAKKLETDRLKFQVGGIFELPELFSEPFDLVIITGVLYPQYIASAKTLVYRAIDKILAPGGILVSVHIDEWYSSRFPYFLAKTISYPYREYFHRLEIYEK